MPKEINLINQHLVLLVIDGFGVGQMPDSKIKANTWQSISQTLTPKQLPVLQKLMTNHQKLDLDYQGADSFLGHLTMSGINVEKVMLKPLQHYRKKIISALKKDGFIVKELEGLIIVNNSVIISDNFEAESGLAINLNGCRDLISFRKQHQIAQIVRQNVMASRVISFGAHHLKISDFLNHILRNEAYVGFDTPKTGVYNDTYDVEHLPILVNYQNAIQQKLYDDYHYEIYMYGKFANIIKLDNFAHQYLEIETSKIFDQLIDDLEKTKKPAVFFVNIQESDLAGHASDLKRYCQVLKTVDFYLQKLLTAFPDLDLVITSDHGNDPLAFTSKHTREQVPLIYVGRRKKILTINKLSQIPKLLEFLITRENIINRITNS